MMDETPTAAGLAWDALVDLAREALPDVQVIDGPNQVYEPERDTLVVGQSDGSEPAVNVTLGPPDLCGRRREEGDIVCVAGSYSGDVAMAPRRQRCAEILGAVVDALKVNPGIGGAVDAAWLGDAAAWTPTQAPDGAFCSVSFTVHYVAEL